MDDGTDDEGDELNYGSIFPKGAKESIDIQVNIVVEPVMDNDIPSTVVRTELKRIPPVRVKGSIRETSNLCPQIEPTMEETKESQDEKDY